MRVLLSIALTAASWGVYGPLLRRGSKEMGDDPWRSFICVGIAYFLVAVLLPALLCHRTFKYRELSTAGCLYSAAAGVAGAIGALGVILAMTSGGNPISVMPSVFGGAPVVSTAVTVAFMRNHRTVKPVVYAGVILVVAGLVAVLSYSPVALKELSSPGHVEVGQNLPAVLTFVSLTVLCWGIYGPILHLGQSLLQGTRLAPFMMVGAAYSVVAAALPFTLLTVAGDTGAFTWRGVGWGLAGGLAGVLGALGVVLAFRFGGKPIVVMPLIFGGAPVVNTCVSMVTSGLKAPSPWFYLGLLAVLAGSTIVLSFAPGRNGAPIAVQG